ncbi:HutD family protein, partial [Rhizobiaceae sp. 2RAB30]
ADHKTMPWKNGGGVTTEIAVFPADAGLDDFLWRVSTARVDQDGPFSMFPGIDRTLSILEGEGLDLTIDGEPVRLTSVSAPYGFAADVPVGSRLIGGSVVDLNVMTRRGLCSSHVRRIQLASLESVGEADAVTMLLPDVRLPIALGARKETVELGDAVLLDPGEAISLHADNDGEAFVITIRH